MSKYCAVCGRVAVEHKEGSFIKCAQFVARVRTWVGESQDFSYEESKLLLRALDALERGPDELSNLRAWLQTWLVDLTAERDDARATLASCDRARRAAEEECERLRTFVVDLEVHHLADEQSVRNMQMVIDTLTADRDRLAERIAALEAELSAEDSAPRFAALAADNAELEAALTAQREALKSCIDSENRLAAMVARVRALVDSGHGVDADVSLVAVSRALDGEVG